MAINEKRDVPKSIQRREWLDRNLGKDNDGHSVLAQTARAVAYAPTFGVWSKALFGKRDGSDVVLGTFCGLGTTFLLGVISNAAHYDFFYDGSIVNDTSFYSDTLTNAADQSGYMIIPTDRDTALMLQRDVDGNYALYQGQEHRQENDYSFVPVTDQMQASRLAFDMAQDFEAEARFNLDGYQAQTISFERISAPFFDEKTEQMIRGGDNIGEITVLQDWSAPELQALFEGAADALEDGKMISIQAEYNQENPLNNDYLDFSTVFLTGWGIMATLMGAGTFAGGVSNSRRRFDREKKRRKEGFSFD